MNSIELNILKNAKKIEEMEKSGEMKPEFFVAIGNCMGLIQARLAFGHLDETYKNFLVESHSSLQQKLCKKTSQVSSKALQIKKPGKIKPVILFLHYDCSSNLLINLMHNILGIWQHT